REAERGTGVSHQRQIEHVGDDLDGLDRRTLELRDGDDLGHDVGRVRDNGDHDKEPETASSLYGMVLWLCRAACWPQRRSSRCLHVMHSVARGNAMSRIFPIGLPHDSHEPYVVS